MLTNFQRRKFRVRNSIIANNKSCRSRIVVFRSNKNVYVQLIGIDGKVIYAYTSLSLKKIRGVEKAKTIGLEFAKGCLSKGAKEVIFDKGAYAYSGRVKAIAEACREGGLVF